MTQQHYPFAPGFKEVTTSKDAAAAVGGKASALRDSVVSTLQWHDRTADEIATDLGVSVLSIRPRVSELHKQGLIEKTGKRRKNSSGMSAHVWRLV